MIFSSIIIIVLSIIAAAFFSGSETAFTSINFMKLLHLVEKKNKRAMLVHDILKRPDRLLAATLIGTNVAVVIAAAFTTKIVFLFNQAFASLIATVIIVPLILVFGEIIPKVVSQNKANRISLIVAPLVALSEKIMTPFIVVIGAITASLIHMIGPRAVKKNPLLTRDEIKLLIRNVATDGIIQDYEKNVIDRIFDFTLTKAADAMVPLKEVIAIQWHFSKDAVIEQSKKHGVTRLPVFEQGKVRGVINIFDIFYHDASFDWHTFVRPLQSVSYEDRLDVVFSKMQPNKDVMVTVLRNETLIGILTMEDLIEMIVSSTQKATDLQHN